MGLGEKSDSDATFPSCLPMSPRASQRNAMKPKAVFVYKNRLSIENE